MPFVVAIRAPDLLTLLNVELSTDCLLSNAGSVLLLQVVLIQLH